MSPTTNTPPGPKIGAKLRIARKNKGLSQEAVADYFEVDRVTVSNWERDMNYPEAKTLVALAGLYGISLDELFGLSAGSAGAPAEGAAERQLSESALMDMLTAQLTGLLEPAGYKVTIHATDGNIRLSARHTSTSARGNRRQGLSQSGLPPQQKKGKTSAKA